MGSANPEPGDQIEIFRFGYQHWAVYVGNGYVVHLAPPRPGSTSVASALTDKAKVKRELLSVVARKHKYRVNNKHDDKYSPLPPSKIVQWAEELVGQELPYSPTSKKCEDFVKELRYGVRCSDQAKPKRGDLIEIFRFGYQHWAVYVGHGYVVHLAPPSEKADPGSAIVASSRTDKVIVKSQLLSVVAERHKYRVNNKHDDKYSPLPPSKIVQRAKEVVGQELPYSPTSKDSEHFVNDLRYGIPRIDQVNDAAKKGGIGTGLVSLFRAGGVACLVGAAALLAFQLIKSMWEKQ